jgi:hypothetical protein
MDLATPTLAAYIPPQLMRLLGIAQKVIGQHVNEGGCCAGCGSARPCRRAQLAEHALAAS